MSHGGRTGFHFRAAGPYGPPHSLQPSDAATVQAAEVTR
ncbi:hypothetical protein JOF55_003459 [Haloactinomyces albus]|uniref:Uncharacterized protein n=1 Tax=Haloactinomyces albus TaxID=1352928 RepID=A0AAE3ZGP3_9ACTN|nr:hypothetical protein [Haloactinomyces albus]